MRNVLFVDATVRPESRTKELAVHLIQKLNGNVKKVKLVDEKLPVLDNDLLQWRNSAIDKGDYSSRYFDYAKDFAEADYIVIAAPYWDLSFPAILKNYIEAITIVGLTFGYTDSGIPEGYCKARKLYYVTTSGGPLYGPEYGSGYIKAMATQMFGVEQFQLIKAENLDIIGADVGKIMADAKANINSMVSYEPSQAER
ncbi:MAG: NAD(P)H-dependent oxidoreductase [Eubacterium sp.]|nr:NAD(P)H-dependent oxidoreductase [Candidatus Colimonas fimequi]